ncbi:MAG: cell shape determining protein MreD [Candidatus Westeberhardia cardiocondylae]|nr:cell shape determining protein MreD [Candidatus Westeberhardia cardiocondylae]
MKIYYKYYITFKMWTSFIIMIIMKIFTQNIQYNHASYYPSLIDLTLIYWNINLPNHINIKTCFILGIIVDLTFHITCGIHALSYIIVYYLIKIKLQCIRNTKLIKKSFFIMISLSIIQFIVFIDEFYQKNINFQQIQYYYLIEGILFPYILWFLQKLKNFLKYYILHI